ncbi:hypothetical protein DFR41_102269 [Pseudacidovorax intermedius]|uniref:Lipoprotein n=1 Tax=Pseudacidovorax intermedius TaxID=433924 RepID=A0A370FN49_9BURK|nr:hypothetical protein [Pseudacidovorax intermedius]RDI27234.1 hypothetical protein DFR41_102269 [Pseudacidovorax intermedius]
MQRLVLLAILGLTAALARAEPAFVQVLPDGKRELFTTRVLAPGDEIQSQFPDSSGRPRCCVKLRVLNTLPDSSRVTDQLNEEHVYSYQLPASDLINGVPFIGAAWTGPFKGKVRNPMPTVCTSNEGAHLLLMERGRPKAHLYMYFGYDVEPTCTERLLARFE